MISCTDCDHRPAAKIIGRCADCIRHLPMPDFSQDFHIPVRKNLGLPLTPPNDQHGILCQFCGNSCRIPPGEKGYCGLRMNRTGKIVNLAPPKRALAHMYLDPLPTNCCAAWFCSGSENRGYNLAVFFYGCNFNCLFCQNSSHKYLKNARTVSGDELVQAALNPSVRCVCFFGGSPEPQLPFAIYVARRIIQESSNTKHICWEWNGCGNPKLVKKAAELSSMSGGTVKFDLKAYHRNMSYALSGVDNRRAYENFAMLAELFPEPDLLTATTLLVSHYVDQIEVESIARFISEIRPEIPYSLLVFHPDFRMNDLPITPRNQVQSAHETARKFLSNVNVGNRHLLQFAS